MKDKMQYLLTLVNDWLKFAEAKNGILIAFNGAAIFGLLQGWSSLNDYIVPFAKYWFIPCSVISLIIAFSSFIPDLDIVAILNKVASRNKVPVNKINIFYFGQIKDVSAEEYVKELYLSENLPLPQLISRSEIDLANQIIINSKIAWQKYKSFEYASTLTLIGVVIPIFLIGIKSIIQIFGK